jgi:phenylacetate-coenzyme A ligase PaaK-like adenylate-forming protein
MTNPVIRFSFTDILKSIITFGQHYRNLNLKREEEFELMKKTGDFELWPFKTKNEYVEQLKRQPFLNGQGKPS